MIFLAQTPNRGEPVERGRIIALAAAIERGDREEAFYELDILFERDAECAEYVALGRRNPARAGQRAKGDIA